MPKNLNLDSVANRLFLISKDLDSLAGALLTSNRPGVSKILTYAAGLIEGSAEALLDDRKRTKSSLRPSA